MYLHMCSDNSKKKIDLNVLVVVVYRHKNLVPQYFPTEVAGKENTIRRITL